MMEKLIFLFLKIWKYPLNLQFFFSGGLRPPDPPYVRGYGNDHPRKFFWEDSKFEENFLLEGVVFKGGIFCWAGQRGLLFKKFSISKIES